MSGSQVSGSAKEATKGSGGGPPGIREAAEDATGLQVWGPSRSDPPVTVVVVDHWDGDLLRRVRAVRDSLGVPVQAVRGDRVLSFAHLVMAFTHHERAVGSSRHHADDPGVDFLRFVAVHKQITRALQDLGVPLDSPSGDRPPVVLVALGRLDPQGLAAAVEKAGLNGARVWEWGAEAPEPIRAVSAFAARYWDDRLSLQSGVGSELRKKRLYAAMALLALET